MMNGLIGYARGLLRLCCFLARRCGFGHLSYVLGVSAILFRLIVSMNGMEIEEFVDDGLKIRSVDDVVSDFL